MPCRSSPAVGSPYGGTCTDAGTTQAVDARGKRCTPTQPPPWPAAEVGLASATDARIDELCDRVKTLENTLAQLLGSANTASDLHSRAASSGTLIRPTHAEDEDDNDDFKDANQFVASTVHDDVSLSSQVAAMRALLPSQPSPGPDGGRPNATAGLLVALPEPGILQHLIDVYFRDFDAYFPFLHRQEFEARVYSAIQRLGYSACNIVVMADIDDLAIVALLCIMLALSECVDPGEGARDGDCKPGWKRYLFCRRAIHHLSRSKPQRPLELDVVRAQCLVAAYLMQCEALPEASQAVTVVWQLATSIRLHNQKVWPKEEPIVALQRRQLWWTIYFLDRQVSRKSGIAYHIRDLEFDVDDFTNNGIESTQGSSIAMSAQPSVVAKGYMQGLIDLARLWGNVWDTFFAVGATKKDDRMEIEIMDARIINTRRQLPGFLTWDSNELTNYLLMGEDESHIRRRLQLYTVSVIANPGTNTNFVLNIWQRLELLRMLIRQNPVRQAAFAPEMAHLCSQLARQIIRAHDLFISRCRSARATGYFTTSSIVECIYHLALVLHHSKDGSEHAACVSAFHQAHSILVRLSSYNKVAHKALKALSGLARRWGTGHSRDRADCADGLKSLAGNDVGLSRLCPTGYYRRDSSISQSTAKLTLEGTVCSIADRLFSAKP